MAVTATGVMAVAVMGGVGWFTTGVRWQRTDAAAQLTPNPARLPTESTIARPRAKDVRSPIPASEAMNRALAREQRKAELARVASAADSAEQQADSVLVDAALGDADAAVREEAIHALGERGSALAVQTLQQTIHDPDPRIRHATVRALPDIGTDEAARILGEALSAKDASLRLAAVEALGDIGSPGAVLYMQQVQGDESAPVREAAAQWLAEFANERR